MTTEMGLSKAAYEKLDPGDIDAAIVLGCDICKELGICCTEKGKVMFKIFKKLRELKPKEVAVAATADEIIDAVQSAFCPSGAEPTEKGGKGGDKNG